MYRRRLETLTELDIVSRDDYNRSTGKTLYVGGIVKVRVLVYYQSVCLHLSKEKDKMVLSSRFESMYYFIRLLENFA